MVLKNGKNMLETANKLKSAESKYEIGQLKKR